MTSVGPPSTAAGTWAGPATSSGVPLPGPTGCTTWCRRTTTTVGGGAVVVGTTESDAAAAVDSSASTADERSARATAVEIPIVAATLAPASTIRDAMPTRWRERERAVRRRSSPVPSEDDRDSVVIVILVLVILVLVVVVIVVVVVVSIVIAIVVNPDQRGGCGGVHRNRIKGTRYRASN